MQHHGFLAAVDFAAEVEVAADALDHVLSVADYSRRQALAVFLGSDHQFLVVVGAGALDCLVYLAAGLGDDDHDAPEPRAHQDVPAQEHLDQVPVALLDTPLLPQQLLQFGIDQGNCGLFYVLLHVEVWPHYG